MKTTRLFEREGWLLLIDRKPLTLVQSARRTRQRTAADAANWVPECGC